MSNVMRIEFSAVPENEAFARAVAAAFVMPLDPTVEELTEIKTAISEAVSNSIIHGYAGCSDRDSLKVVMSCETSGRGKLVMTVCDYGVGIENVEKAMEPMFSTVDSAERSGMGFTVMESFTDKLKVDSQLGRGTTVTMTKYLDVVSGI